MTNPAAEVTLEVVAATDPAATFDALVPALLGSLRRRGLVVESRTDGSIRDGGATIGRVVRYDRGRGLELEWIPTPWAPGTACRMRLTISPRESGSGVRLEVTQGSTSLGLSGDDLTEWTAASVIAPVIAAWTPPAVGEWLTDVRARRPSGISARATYGDPTYHWPNFLLILDRIALGPSDRLLEVACGGGAFLRRALESGCRATGVDHSPEMVELAREQNAGAIDTGRAEILEGDAANLPVPDAEFTCCVNTGAIGFFPDPGAALAEMRRALRPGGRLAVYSGTAALRGTPAAPEPIASRIRFFEPDELTALARDAGFEDVRAEMPDLEPYARKAGLPEDVIAFFRGVEGSILLSARRP